MEDLYYVENNLCEFIKKGIRYVINHMFLKCNKLKGKEQKETICESVIYLTILSLWLFITYYKNDCYVLI